MEMQQNNRNKENENTSTDYVMGKAVVQEKGIYPHLA
jgi:hypothetical protein